MKNNRLTSFYLWVYFPFMSRFVFPLTSLFNRLFASSLKKIFILLGANILESEMHSCRHKLYVSNHVYSIPYSSMYFVYSLQRINIVSFTKKFILFIMYNSYFYLVKQNASFYYIRELLSFVVLLLNSIIKSILFLIHRDVVFIHDFKNNLIVKFFSNIFYKFLGFFVFHFYNIKRKIKKKDKIKHIINRLELKEKYYNVLESIGFEIDESVKRKLEDVTDADRKIRMVKFRSFSGFAKNNDFSAKDIASNKGNYSDFDLEDNFRNNVRLRPDIKAKMTEAFNPFVNLYGEDSEIEFYVNSVDNNVVKDMVKTDAIDLAYRYVFFSKFTTKFKFVSIFLVYSLSILDFFVDLINEFLLRFTILSIRDDDDKYVHSITSPKNPFRTAYDRLDKMTTFMVALKTRNHRMFSHTLVLILLTGCLFSVFTVNIFCLDGYAYYGPSQLISSKAPFAPFFVGFVYLIYLIHYHNKFLITDYMNIRAMRLQQVKYDEKEESVLNKVEYSLSFLFTIATAAYYTSYININSPHFLMRVDVLKRMKKMYKNDTTVYSDLLIYPLRETTSTLSIELYRLKYYVVKACIIQYNDTVAFFLNLIS